MHRLRLTAIVAAVSLPIAVFAAALKPSEMLALVQFKGKPMDIAYETYVHADDVSFSAKLTGEVEGKDPASLKTNMRLTFDFADSENTMHGQAQMRIAQKMVYVLIEKVDGHLQQEYGNMMGQFSNKQWYAVPMDESLLQKQGGVSNAEAEAIIRNVMDAIFSLQQTSQNGGTTYTLALKRNAAAQIQKLLPKLQAKYPSSRLSTIGNRDVAQLRKILSKMYVRIKTVFDANGNARSLKLYTTFKQKDIDVVLTGTLTVRQNRVTVTVPTDAQLLNEQTFQ